METINKGEYALQVAEMANKYGDTTAQLTATVRRCPAVLMIVSDRSHTSPYCQLEAFVTGVIHSFWTQSRIRDEAGVYTILERRGIEPLPMLAGFWSRVYQPGLERSMAALIANEISRLAAILRMVEARRAKIDR